MLHIPTSIDRSCSVGVHSFVDLRESHLKVSAEGKITISGDCACNTSSEVGLTTTFVHTIVQRNYVKKMDIEGEKYAIKTWVLMNKEIIFDTSEKIVGQEKNNELWSAQYFSYARSFVSS